MNMTLNLYSGKKYYFEEVQQQLLDKDPVVFIIPENESIDSVYTMLNISRDLNKYICVSNGYQSSRVVAFLASFRDANKRKILVMAPNNSKQASITFTNNVLSCLSRINKTRSIKIRQKKRAVTSLDDLRQ